MALDYDDFQVQFNASWLGGENGTMWSRVLGTIKNAIKEAAKSAVKNRFSSEATIDSLVALLEDRNLDPAWHEDETSVRARIKAAWSTWGKAGTKEGVAEALELAGYTNFVINDAADDGTLNWWEFEIIISTPFPWTDTSHSDGAWDDAGSWDDGGSWAASIPTPELARLRLIVRKWGGHNNGHTKCRRIVLIHSGETWDETAPPGEWDDDPNATWTDDASYISP